MDRLYWVGVDWREINFIIDVLEKKGKYYEWKKYIIIRINYLNNYGSIKRGINQFNFHI